MADDKKDIMSEPYKEFENSAWPNIGITFKNQTFKFREILLAVVTVVLFIAVIVLAIVLGVSAGKKTCVTKGCLEASSYVLLSLNTSAKPCDDFYSYACGQFKSWTYLKASESEVTIFSRLADVNHERLGGVLATPPSRLTDHAWDRKIKELFQSCTDQYGKDIAGANPFLKQLVPNAGGWWMVDSSWNPTTWDLTTAIQKVHVDFWTNALFTFYVVADPMDNSKNIVEIDFSGLGMYWRYYIDSDSEQIRTAYRKFIRTIAQLYMKDPSLGNLQDKDMRINTFVADVMDFEIKLANVTHYTVPTDSPHLPDMRKTLQELNQMAGMIQWDKFFKYMFKDGGMTDSTKLVLLEHDYLSKVSDMVGSLGVNKTRIMNNYLMWRMAQSYAQDLSWEFVHANREFYVARTGRQAFLGSYMYCFNYVGRKMGTGLGKLFVDNHFDRKDKESAETLVKYLKMALKDMLKNAYWMDNATKTTAAKKIEAITDKIGAPDFSTSLDDLYADFKVNKSDFFQNVLSMNLWEVKDWNRRLKQGKDDDAWAYAVYDTAMYYYNPWNELLVPAGMLQFPLYDKRLPMYMNFGSMGVVMSHELVHSIDELGGYYTQQGKFFDWWSNATTQNYRKARQCIIDFYTNKTAGPYRVDNKVHKVKINARSYAMEAIAETYGLKQAYLAYQRWVKDNNVEPVAPGLNLTNEQAFFVSFGQTYCFNRNDAYSYQLVMRNRVPENIAMNGAVSQLDEFQKAFNCPANAKLNAKKKCNMF